MKLIFLHGLGQSPSSWNEILISLPKHIEPLCPSLFGLLEDGEISYERMYTALEKYIEEFSEPVNLCGISLGAVLALNYTIDHIEKVSSLVLIAPQYKMPKLLLKIQNMVFHVMPEHSFSKSGLKKSDMIQLTKSMAPLNFQKDLHKITCPSFIICGERDKANRKAAKALTNLIPGAGFGLIDSTGHEVNVEAPYKLSNEIDLFYKHMKK